MSCQPVLRQPSARQVARDLCRRFPCSRVILSGRVPFILFSNNPVVVAYRSIKASRITPLKGAPGSSGACASAGLHARVSPARVARPRPASRCWRRALNVDPPWLRRARAR